MELTAFSAVWAQCTKATMPTVPTMVLASVILDAVDMMLVQQYCRMMDNEKSSGTYDMQAKLGDRQAQANPIPPRLWPQLVHPAATCISFIDLAALSPTPLLPPTYSPPPIP